VGNILALSKAIMVVGTILAVAVIAMLAALATGVISKSTIWRFRRRDFRDGGDIWLGDSSNTRHFFR